MMNNLDTFRSVRASKLLNISSQKKKVLTNLIKNEVHGRDIVEHLISEKVEDPNSFAWTAQLRTYWDKDCFVKCMEATVPFGYEYLGNY